MERNSTFAARHPVTVFIYWLSGVLFTMMTMRVEVLLGSFFPAALYCLYLEGAKMFKWLAGWFLSVGIFLMVILPLFNHRGATPLFYIQGQAVTKESVLMGAVVTLMLVSVLLWMRLGLYLLDSEKLLYLSGRIVPALGLMLSQIFRMIPLMKKRYIQVHEGLMGLGMVPKEASFWKRARHFARELSVLIAWSLEGTVETSISMESRGYGAGKRTSFHRFRFRLEDGWFVAAFLVLSGVGIGMAVAGGYEVYYYPELQAVPLGGKALAGIVCGGLAGMIPMGYDIYWNRKERNYDTHH